jgi:hypothetical protein
LKEESKKVFVVGKTNQNSLALLKVIAIFGENSSRGYEPTHQIDIEALLGLFVLPSFAGGDR